MRWKWALVASLALAACAATEARAQTATEWGRKAEPIEGRPGEYRTLTTETWIRLTPYVGWLFWDGGTLMTNGPQFGLALEFEPADLLIASIDIGTNIPIHGWGCERRFTEGRNGTDGDQELEGLALHPALYVGLKNPEIRLGILQPIIGLGVGAFILRDYEGDLPVAGGGSATVSFANSIVAHGTIFLRFDLDISPGFKFGINLKHHILVYATKEWLGNMEPDKFRLDNLHYAFEPSVYFSIAF